MNRERTVGPAELAFKALVKEKTDRGVSQDRAVRDVVKTRPDLHQEMLAESNGRG